MRTMQKDAEKETVQKETLQLKIFYDPSRLGELLLQHLAEFFGIL